MTGRTRGLRGAARGVTAAAVVAALVIAGTTAVLADCGAVNVATLSGQWQLKETVAGYTPGPLFGIFKTAGFQSVDNVTFTSTCTAAGQCAVGIEPNANGGNFRFNSTSPIEFTGPDSSQAMRQAGANIAGTYATVGGIGGPGLPPCRPPTGYIDASTTFHVVSAVRDAQGAWHATLITGTYSQTAGIWKCQGGAGVDGAIEHVVLEAVPAGAAFPAQIPTTCASAKRSPHAVPPVNPDESSIASALSTPGDAFSSLSGSLINAAITIGIILFITFPSQLFNHTFEENYDEIRAIASRRLGWLRRLRREASATASTARSALIFGGVVLAGAVLGGTKRSEVRVQRPVGDDLPRRHPRDPGGRHRVSAREPHVPPRPRPGHALEVPRAPGGSAGRRDVRARLSPVGVSTRLSVRRDRGHRVRGDARSR